eukprot:jgi/Tetstr1/420884/TSEL_011947.t1
MRNVLRHLWACYATAPSITAGTFVLPIWAEAPWRRLTGGGAQWHSLLTGADGLEDLRLRSSTIDTYRSNLRDYCSFCAARGATPLPATLGLMRGYIYNCIERLLARPVHHRRPASGHLRLAPHLRLAGRPTLKTCKDESIGTLVAILKRRTTGLARGRHPLRIPYVRAMPHRDFSLSPAFGKHTRICVTFLNLGCLRRKATVALACDYRVSGSGSYKDLSAVMLEYAL